jgi:hypothetical protein
MADLVKYTGPWKGLNTDNPENSIDAHEAAQCDNFILRGGEIISAPRLSQCSQGLQYQSEICRGITSFLDENNLWHTMAFSDVSAYQLSNTRQWKFLSKLPIRGGGSSAFAVLITKMFMVNYSPFLYSWGGITNTLGVEYAGIGAKYIVELDSRLLLLNTVEVVNGSVQYFEQRIRATPSGVTNVFSPSDSGGLATGAWFVDMLDCPDVIMGCITVGASAYILRTNGISQLTPLSTSGNNPFTINHMWASERGMGNIYAQACAQYGSIGIFVSTEDVYQLSPSGFNSIAPTVRYKLLSDLSNATFTPMGAIIPQLAQGFVYPMYVLSIPTGNNTVLWCYAINEQQWFRRLLPGKLLTAPPKFVIVE